MKGTKLLNNDEIRRIAAAFIGTFEIRNRALLMPDVSLGNFYQHKEVDLNYFSIDDAVDAD